MKCNLAGLLVLVLMLVRLGSGCSSDAAANDAGAGAGGAPVGTGGAAGVGGLGVGGATGADAGATPDAGKNDGAVDAQNDAAAATFTQVWTNVLTECSSGASPCCVGCHDGSLTGLPDYSTKALAYSTLVGVASVKCAGVRVTAGNAEASVLVNKLRAKPNLALATVCGGQPMPLMGEISLDQLHQIEAWINAGALNN
jgi:hypothetical protein